ncbi:hypothetical protein ACB092_11G120600 [Castanea dentata]
MTLMTSPPLDQQQPQPQPQPQLQPKQEDDEMLVPNTDLLEGPQPMAVAQAETTSTVEAQAVNDPSSVRFTWTIDNFSRRNRKRLYSDVFFVGGYKWRILLFPKGNNVDHLSMYLGVADSTNLPYGWSRYAQFSLSVINQIHNKYSIRKETQGQFNARERDWGFTSFMPLGELYDPGRGYLVNNTCIVEAAVAESVPRAQTKTKVIPSTLEASIQEMTSNKETESNAKRGYSNGVYAENPQEKEDFAEATSKDQEGESTQTDSDPLFSLLSPDLRATCSQLLSKYPETMKDANKWTLSLRGFLLGQIGFVVSQLQSKGKENCLALPLDDFLSTLSEVEGLSVNVGWLKSRVTVLRDLKRAGPSIHASLSSLRELRAKESSCINKVKETVSALEVHGTSIAQLQVELASKQEVSSALQAQLEDVTVERSSLRKEIEKLEGELGALSHPDFSFENIGFLTNII